MTDTYGAYHDRRYPIPDGWQQTAELPGHHGLHYVWIEPVCAEPHNRELCAKPHSEQYDG